MAYQGSVPALEVRLVGRLRVVADDRELTDQAIGTRKARLLLQRLAGARGEVLPVDALAEAVWGERPPSAPVDNLATLVSRLRSTLGADIVTGDRNGWRLGPTVRVDLDAAAGLVVQAQTASGRGEPAVAAAAAARAVAALTGDVLADAPAAGWAEDVRDETAALLRRARRVAAAASLDAGDLVSAVDVAQAAARADPYDEVAARVLMQAYRAGGEPGRALAVYDVLRRRLADDLGTDPAPQTRALHLELLTESGPGTSPTVAASAASADLLADDVRTGGRPALRSRAGAARAVDAGRARAGVGGPAAALGGRGRQAGPGCCWSPASRASARRG